MAHISLKTILFIGILSIIQFSTIPLFADEPQITLTASQEKLLDEIQKKVLNYFIQERNPETGLIRDWAWNKPVASNSLGTITGIGFALTAYGIGVERGWLDRGEALEMTKNTLRFLRDQVPQEHGFFYHFLKLDSGTPVPDTEVSPVDTALALAGVLFAKEYFNDPEITSMAEEIFNRTEWPWMLNEGKTFALAWRPRGGFLKTRWSTYSEGILIYLLALGSPTHPISSESWHAIQKRVGSYGPYRAIECAPLFTHQYPHIWIDFRNRNDGFADYFENSKQVTLAHRQFAIDQSQNYKSYGPNSWGLSAAEGPSEYRAYGAPPGWADHDGTIAPTACISSIPFTPKESLACAEHLKETHGNKLWGRYSFSDAFNLDRNWYSNKAFAINQGPMILMIENFRSGLIWNVMSRSAIVQAGLKKAGFREGTIPLRWKNPPEITIPQTAGPISIDTNLSDWPQNIPTITLDQTSIENGEIANDHDLRGTIQFAWDEQFLYFAAKVEDDSSILVRSKDQIWQDDLLELFIDPQGDGLYWYKPSDYQIGFRPTLNSDEIKTWSWFQGGRDPAQGEQVLAKGSLYGGGYTIEGRIAWNMLHFEPQIGKTLHLTPAVHDADQDRTEAKVIWFFRNEREQNRFEIGRLKLT
ncbi:MAG: hypothetical protein HYS55_04415 [Candidatus Omnitrophica bacterium]|nr:hypothetical protein [Candidatus Omnitrophota bacterium]